MHFFDTLNFNAVPFWQLSFTVWTLILLALAFDFLNGFHDAANSIATIVSTRVLSPMQAVVWAAFFNFIAFALFHLSVAATMGKGIIDPGIVDNRIIAATLIGACFWDILTWFYGLPTSSSHALIGGLIGSALMKSGWSAMQWHGIGKAALFIFLAPLIGMAIGVLISIIVSWSFWKVPFGTANWVFRRGQLLSAALYSLGHGGNDAQKTMGIIYVLLIAASAQGAAFATPREVPTEVVLACHVAMGLGTLFGGWRIVKTMGQRIVHLRPVDGFCAETGAAATLVLTLGFGIPVSTTQTITGSIIGVGSMKGPRAVRWGMAGRVVWAWILTIPGTALVSMACWLALWWLPT